MAFYEFDVAGPHKIVATRTPGGRVIQRPAIASFWRDHVNTRDNVGVYVFGLQHGRGITPWYVGKATVSFQQEVFTPHKLHHYQVALAMQRRGTPVLLFVRERRRGTSLSETIGAVEKQLIRFAKMKNPELLNTRDVGAINWRIRGYINSGRGTPSVAARALAAAVPVR